MISINVVAAIRKLAMDHEQNKSMRENTRPKDSLSLRLIVAVGILLTGTAAILLSWSFAVPDPGTLVGTYIPVPQLLGLPSSAPTRLTIDPNGKMRLDFGAGRAADSGGVHWDAKELTFRSKYDSLEMRVRVVPDWFSYHVFVRVHPGLGRYEEYEFRRL